MMNKLNSAVMAVLFFGFMPNSPAQAQSLSRYNVQMKPSQIWLEQEAAIAEEKLLQNISPKGTALGTVIASPQTENPNYFRHWVRDAALTMQTVFQLSKRTQNLSEIHHFNDLLKTYTILSRQEQLSAGIGEPIFEVTGSVFTGPWGRPQNDGPALRAIVLTEWANELLDQGESDFVKKYLYDSVLPSNSVVKNDLEYVSWHWADPCFDLWEEVKASHFYTKMVQRKALLSGAQLARRLNDSSAANWYEQQASYLEKSILDHAHTNQDWIAASLNWTEGLNSKHSNLDIAVILGVLHGRYDHFFKPSDVAVQKTFTKLTNVFSQLYPVNRNDQSMAAALGRYPEDIYAGTNFQGGNPWVLATLAGAEYSYRVASELASRNLRRAENWMQIGDRFVQRVQYHANPDGSLSEQIDRYSGYMSSARDLTWNYSAVLTTLWARKESQKNIETIKFKLQKNTNRITKGKNK